MSILYQLNWRRARKFNTKGFVVAHKVYKAIVTAVKKGTLKEPFNTKEFEKACPGFAKGTYNAFLYKHRKGNPGKNSELFERVTPGKFICIRKKRFPSAYALSVLSLEELGKYFIIEDFIWHSRIDRNFPRHEKDFLKFNAVMGSGLAFCY